MCIPVHRRQALNALSRSSVIVTVRRALTFVCCQIQDKTSCCTGLTILCCLVPMFVWTATLALGGSLVPVIKMRAAYTGQVGGKMGMGSWTDAVSCCWIDYQCSGTDQASAVRGKPGSRRRTMLTILWCIEEHEFVSIAAAGKISKQNLIIWAQSRLIEIMRDRYALCKIQ